MKLFQKIILYNMKEPSKSTRHLQRLLVLLNDYYLHRCILLHPCLWTLSIFCFIFNKHEVSGFATTSICRFACYGTFIYTRLF